VLHLLRDVAHAKLHFHEDFFCGMFEISQLRDYLLMLAPCYRNNAAEFVEKNDPGRRRPLVYG